ncbi:hypothetical protein HPHPA26_0221 [Helicobacter pylori Hp A-26]|uniref:Uncharacterized protein n=1 Tax=Helicobacter pylori Hp A-26 TaxID=992056 RepID=I9U308_HELPX|nr:hypothetical protein HPHPA26_0221 [Helicobacter pylori Hp A-26]
MNSALKSIVKSICLLFENYGAFKFCKIIACCLITPNPPKKRSVWN